MQPNKKAGFLFVISLFLFIVNTQAQDSNFHIYLAFGQSNMEGQGAISPVDTVKNERFQVLAAVSCSNLSRTMGTWYTAVPPLFRCYTKLSPLDYFGKTLADSLPSTIRIGVVPVAVAGTGIDLFDKDEYSTYLSTAADWLKNIAKDYGNNPYGRLVDLAKQAQKVGVIKGILMHQGESDGGNSNWSTTVKKVYTDLLNDLGLDSAQVPLLVGEVVHEDQQGTCAGMNANIDKLPQLISTAHVISSKGCTDTTDNLHFNAAGYRELGKRYAQTMLTLLKTETVEQAPYKDTLTIPGTIQAEDYDKGGQGVSYYDTDIGNSGNVYRDDGADVDSAGGAYFYGWTANDEWIEWTVKITSATTMKYTANVASQSTSASFSLYIDGSPIVQSITVPNTGSWTTFQEITGTTSALAIGTHVLKLSVDAAYFNIDWIRFEDPTTKSQSVPKKGKFSLPPNTRYFDLLGRKLSKESSP